MKIAIIPARAGSQRIKRKNTKSFCGKPMITWTIEKLIDSNIFDKILVSTDDIETQNIAVKLGVEVPFIRPKNLSDSHTATVPVISHAIQQVKKLNWNVRYACCIYPCTPFLETNDIKESFDILYKNNHNFVYPVVEYPHPIQRSMIRDETGKIKFKYPEYELTRTQDLESFFHDSGQFYWGKSEAWLKGLKMHTDGVSIKIPSWRALDIDTNEDWEKAEKIFKGNLL